MRQLFETIKTKRNTERVGLDVTQNNKFESENLTPILSFLKDDIVKIAFDARLFETITDVSKHFFLLLAIQASKLSILRIILSTTDFFAVYHQIELTEETRKILFLVVRN